ncbi:MAG: ferritin [Cyclobacteriaceae bacterium]
MKDIVRMRTSLSEEIEALLNEQVKKEAKSSFNYLAMAAWCERKGFANSAKFFEIQSDEERQHMKKIFNYISSVGGVAITPDVVDIQQEYDSFRSVFDLALEQEVAITHSISNIVDKCTATKDYTTANFLNWFLTEQVEEEAIARRCLEIFDIVDQQGLGFLMIDREIALVREQAPGDEG